MTNKEDYAKYVEQSINSGTNESIVGYADYCRYYAGFSYGEPQTIEDDENDDEPPVLSVLYKNYRGITAERNIRPISIFYGSDQYHPKPQWLLRCIDTDRNVERVFAVKDIQKFL